MQQKLQIKNKKAEFNYELVDKYQAGLILTGTEIKSIRDGKINMSDAFCVFKGDTLWVRNLNISAFDKGTIYNHEPLRLRQLLLRKKELMKIQSRVKERGFTIVPTAVYLNDRGIAKIEIATAKGKKTYNKKDSKKEKDIKRDTERQLRDK